MYFYAFGLTIRNNKSILSLDNLSTCLTRTGKSCIFPFKYSGLNYTRCTPKDKLLGSWCATKLDANGVSYGLWGSMQTTAQRTV